MMLMVVKMIQMRRTVRSVRVSGTLDTIRGNMMATGHRYYFSLTNHLKMYL